MEAQHPSAKEPLEPSIDAVSPAEVSSQDHPIPSAPSEHIPEEPAKATSATRPLTLEELIPPPETSDRLPTSRPSTQQPWRTPTRRQVLTGVGILIGIAAIGTSTTVALMSNSSSTGSFSSSSSTGPSATATAGASGMPPVQTPVSEDTLQAWRTKRLTPHPTQRFKHHTGTAVVPLSVVEPHYPNPYNPYYIHVQGYVLGGTLVARTQFFVYLGLESLDGSQFVAKMRVGPVDQTSKTFGLRVVQQSTDDIEGGPAEFPQVTLAPKALYHALPALADHCIEIDCIRQPLPTHTSGIPPSMLAEVNQQATISDQFLRADYAAIHRAPLALLPASELDPIRYLIDDSPITYHTAADAGRYPLVTQLTLRHSDHLYTKLVSGQMK